MSEADFPKKEIKTSIAVIILFLCAVQVGIVLFGINFNATKTVLRDTAEAQKNMTEALTGFTEGFDPVRLDVRYNYTVRAYISKKKYLNVGMNGRNEMIKTLGKIWC